MKKALLFALIATVTAISRPVAAQDTTAQNLLRATILAIDRGDCQTAQKKFNIWKAYTGQSNDNIQKLITQCAGDAQAHALPYDTIPGTKLMITKKPVANVKYSDAVSMCANLRYGGFTNWRLPTKGEAYTIVAAKKNNELSFWANSTWMNSGGTAYNADNSNKNNCFCVRDTYTTTATVQCR